MAGLMLELAAGREHRALKGAAPPENLVSAVEFLEEHYIRDLVLTPEEFARMLKGLPDYLKPVLPYDYHTGLRKGEILGLTRDRIALKAGFIRLKGIDTKSPQTCRRGCPYSLEDHRGQDGAVFKRYNMLDEDDLAAARRQVVTYMDTGAVKSQERRL
jgi:integrase